MLESLDHRTISEKGLFEMMTIVDSEDVSVPASKVVNGPHEHLHKKKKQIVVTFNTTRPS